MKNKNSINTIALLICRFLTFWTCFTYSKHFEFITLYKISRLQFHLWLNLFKVIITFLFSRVTVPLILRQHFEFVLTWPSYTKSEGSVFSSDFILIGIRPGKYSERESKAEFGQGKSF
jgi:hypothetical protein